MTTEQTEPAEHDAQAEKDKAAFTTWAKAEGYDDDERYDFDEMEFAFTSGMEAQRAAVAQLVKNWEAQAAEEIRIAEIAPTGYSLHARKATTLRECARQLGMALGQQS